jgi:hypothetical protein
MAGDLLGRARDGDHRGCGRTVRCGRLMPGTQASRGIRLPILDQRLIVPCDGRRVEFVHGARGEMHQCRARGRGA